MFLQGCLDTELLWFDAVSWLKRERFWQWASKTAWFVAALLDACKFWLFEVSTPFTSVILLLTFLGTMQKSWCLCIHPWGLSMCPPPGPALFPSDGTVEFQIHLNEIDPQCLQLRLMLLSWNAIAFIFHYKRILSWVGQQLSRNSFFQGAVLDLSANPVGWEGLMEANGVLRDIYCFVFHCNLSWESIACIWVTFFFLTSFLIHCYLYEILQICVCTEDKAVGEQQNWGLLSMCWNYGCSEWYGSRMLSSGF